MSVFMHVSCSTDNLQFKNTDWGEKRKSLDDDPYIHITFKKRGEEGKGQWGEAELGEWSWV